MYRRPEAPLQRFLAGGGRGSIDRVSTIATAIGELRERIPWAKAAGWDPVGLQVGDPSAAAGRIGVCHDVTADVLDAASSSGVSLLIAYHPVLFEASRRFVAGSSQAGLAFEAVRRGIAIAVAHTAFDVAPGGTADALATALDLEQTEPFGPLWGPATVKIVTFVPPDSVDAVAGAMAAAGAGEIGGYTGCSFRTTGMGTFFGEAGTSPTIGEAGAPMRVDEVRLEMVASQATVDSVVAALVGAHPYEEPAFDVFERRGDAGFVGRVGKWEGTVGGLVTLVQEKLGRVVRTAGDWERSLSRIAVVPGSGASVLSAAIAAGADAIVTGDLKHHDARWAVARGLVAIDPGHAATERPGVASLYAAVAAGRDDVADLTGVDNDPWTV